MRIARGIVVAGSRTSSAERGDARVPGEREEAQPGRLQHAERARVVQRQARDTSAPPEAAIATTTVGQHRQHDGDDDPW